jgi:hypothetical protein
MRRVLLLPVVYLILLGATILVYPDASLGQLVTLSLVAILFLVFGLGVAYLLKNLRG